VISRYFVLRAAVTQFHDTDFAVVGEEGNSSSTRSAVDPHTCYVFLNRTNGEGVDIYFMLVTQSGDYVLIMDQRKVRNETVRTATMSDQAQKDSLVHRTLRVPLIVRN
jgi:hypothetical protein